jgi:membrane protease subunit HflK
MQQILSSTSKVLSDTKGSSNLLYLPLDKLIQKSAQAADPAASAAVLPEGAALMKPGAAPEVPMPLEGGPRSRDGALRNRERGDR